MKFNKTPLANSYIIEPEPFQDHRGMFSRIFCMNELKEINHFKEIVQINHSATILKGAIRGMHYQLPPKAEIKIVKCIKGSVFDVIIDLRKESSTFLKCYCEVLSEENMKAMYIPERFAHGYQTLTSNCELLYFHTETYSPNHERGIRYDDPLIEIKWPLNVKDLSKKDREYPLLAKKFKGIDYNEMSTL